MALPPESRGKMKLIVAATQTTTKKRTIRRIRYSSLMVRRPPCCGELARRGLQLIENERERQVPEGAIDVRVLLVRPTRPVGVVVRNAVVPLLDRNIRQLRQPDRHSPLPLIQQLGLIGGGSHGHL